MEKFINLEGVRQMGREVGKAVSKKQNKLSVSEDLALTEDGALSLTEMAKKHLFNDQWTTWGGTVSGSTYRKGGVDMDYAKALRVYGRHKLIDEATTGGAVFNYSTEFFELNGLVDLTAQDMENILLFGTFFPHYYGAGSTIAAIPTNRLIRTNILAENSSDILRGNCTFDHLCYSQNRLEVFVACTDITSDVDSTYKMSPTSLTAAFQSCTKLKKVIGTVNLDRYVYSASDYVFRNCTALEEIHFHRLKTGLNLQAPALSLASISELVEFAINTAPVTVTLHPGAYARLTEELIAQAAAKQITFTTT